MTIAPPTPPDLAGYSDEMLHTAIAELSHPRAGTWETDRLTQLQAELTRRRAKRRQPKKPLPFIIS